MKIISLICLVCFFWHAACDKSVTLVKTRSGPIEGKVSSDWGTPVKQFLGIPYATPPVGELRFKKPIPIKPWKNAIKATQNGPACIQYTKSPFMWYDSESGKSEDCLYLNIFTPISAKKGSDLAVIFFIHGGGFTFGSNRKKIYDGSGLVLQGNVIVVTINYRLGLFGFLTSDSEDAPGNAGLYDMVMALHWIHDNIEFFGGDKNRITVHGQNAGSLATSLLCVSPLTKGLFSRAILESASATFLKYNQKQANLNFSQQIAKAVGCASHQQTITSDSKNIVNCLREKNATYLAEVQWTFIPHDFLSFFPQYGDEILPTNAADDIRNGKFHDVPLLIGNDKDEGSFQITTRNPQTFGFFGEKDTKINKTQGEVMIRGYFKNFTHPEKYVKHYLGNVPNNELDLIRRQVYTASGDYTILCHTVYFAESYAKKGNDVYFYFFVHRPSNSEWASWMGTTDFDEVEFVFGRPVRKPWRYPSEERSLSFKLLNIWTHFANYGYPSDTFKWPKYSIQNHTYVVIDTDFKGDRFGTGPHLDNCNVMRDYYGF
ncbi:Acetylcholinesterase-1 like protein [Argiope bruennichi]|uniref:acetylcholinesterase n=1 Tax=Argiope bruennichi TaxID=94029 RepID=A0A8T0EF17_ARGBR|nr:Acetylcholinesterase-1 like protein [Argiope bruennichi]